MAGSWWLPSRGVYLHRPPAAARRRREDAVQPEIVRELAVVIGPILVHLEDHRGPGNLAAIKTGNHLPELAVAEPRQHGVAEGKGAIEAGHQLRHAVTRRELGLFRRLGPPDRRAAEFIVARQVERDVSH